MTKTEKLMVKWLCKGVRKASKMQAPPDGALRSVLYGDLEKDGGHWQVDLVHDTRIQAKPYVGVWYWKKRRDQHGAYHVSERRG